MKVEVRNGDVDKALSILKKKLFDDNRIREVMDRQYYKKPSEIRVARKKEALNRHRKLIAKEKSRLTKHRY